MTHLSCLLPSALGAKTARFVRAVAQATVVLHVTRVRIKLDGA